MTCPWCHTIHPLHGLGPNFSLWIWVCTTSINQIIQEFLPSWHGQSSYLWPRTLWLLPSLGNYGLVGWKVRYWQKAWNVEVITEWNEWVIRNQGGLLFIGVILIIDFNFFKTLTSPPGTTMLISLFFILLLRPWKASSWEQARLIHDCVSGAWNGSGMWQMVSKYLSNVWMNRRGGRRLVAAYHSWCFGLILLGNLSGNYLRKLFPYKQGVVEKGAAIWSSVENFLLKSKSYNQ